MAHTCSECTYLNVGGDTKDGKFWCEYKCEWVYANQLECWKYCTAYNRSDSVARSAKEYSERNQSSGSGCYMTTALCDIMNMPDDNHYLQTLRRFRKDYLQRNVRGIKILLEYDVIGPKISQMLEKEQSKFSMAYTLFSNYIVPIVESIGMEQYEKAIQIYTEMTNKLVKYYNINQNMNLTIDEIEPSLSGHGRIVKKLA